MSLLRQQVAAQRPLAPVLGALAALTLACWGYLLLVRAAPVDAPWAMPMTASWSVADALAMWAMWAVMMAAMMLPSAAPMVAAYAHTLRGPRSVVHGSTPLFVAAYVAVWAGFAGAAAAGQWGLHQAGLVDAMGVSRSGWLAAGALLVAGGYQFSDLKHTMLRRCRSPLGFILGSWREGPRGAAVMGLHHGVLCLGCCWLLMGLLFVLGVLNLWWVAVLATAVLLEKVTRSPQVPRVLGVVLVGAGLLVLAQTVLA